MNIEYDLGSSVSLPNWNMAGVIPPIASSASPTGRDRSPYKVSMHDLICRFSISQHRAGILSGLIQYRKHLYSIGITTGFQWVDGSFVEDVETNESRTPNDIDVVSFVDLPKNATQVSFFPTLKPLMDVSLMKARYNVDPYIMELSKLDVDSVCYWYSLWSHRRDGVWKGFAEIKLDQIGDLAAEQHLNSLISNGLPT